ncbi:hypothetical protein ACJ7K1_21295 [Paenibacillus elgii]
MHADKNNIGGAVQYAVFGHVPYRKRARLGQTEFVCGCLGDRKEWRHPDDVGRELPHAFTTIAIG